MFYAKVKEELRQLEMEDPQTSNVEHNYNVSTISGGTAGGRRKGSKETTGDSSVATAASIPVPQPRSSRA